MKYLFAFALLAAVASCSQSTQQLQGTPATGIVDEVDYGAAGERSCAVSFRVNNEQLTRIDFAASTDWSNHSKCRMLRQGNEVPVIITADGTAKINWRRI